MPFLFAIILLFFAHVGNVAAQEVATSRIDSLKQYPVSLYKEATVTSQNLFNGRRYFLYDALSEEHQFLGERKWYTGYVHFDGQPFDSVAIMYDIYKQQVLIKDLEANYLILSNDRLSSFSVEEWHFKKLLVGVDLPSYMDSGFYQVLHNGSIKYLVYRKKSRQELIKDMKIIPYYENKDRHYIQKEGDYWPVQSKKSVYALFPTYKRPLKKFVRQNRLKFTKDVKENSMIELIRYYDEISQK